MIKDDLNRIRGVYVGLPINQYFEIQSQCKKSTCHTVSEYIRKRLSDEPVTILYRNQSLDDLIEEIAELNNQINIVRNNASQVLEKQSQHQQINHDVVSISGLEIAIKNLDQRIEEIKLQIEKIIDKWLQS
jgi:carboxypeptidase C (cathepsin A)